MIAERQLFTRKRTLKPDDGMSEMCQKQSSREALFDHLVGSHEERLRVS